MPIRFLSSNAAGAELPWQTMADLLDALEDGRLDADDYVFDPARQAWQPIRKHSEIVEAWERRMHYRPPEARRLLVSAARPQAGFPALSPEGTTPVSSPAVARIEAARAARTPAQPEDIPAVRSAVVFGEAGFILVVLALLGAGLVLLAQAFVGVVGGTGGG